MTPLIATFTPIVTLRSSRNPSVRTSEALDETDREYTTYTGSDQESPKIQRNTKKRLTEKTHILALKDSSRDGDDDDTAAPTPLTAIPRSTSHIKLPLYTESSSESFKRPRVDELSSDFIPPAPGMVGNKRSSWSREGGSGGVSDSGSVKRPHTTPITAKELPPLPHNAASTSPSQQNFPDIIQVVQPNAKRLAKNLHEQAVWNNWIAKVEDLEKKISDDGK